MHLKTQMALDAYALVTSPTVAAAVGPSLRLHAWLALKSTRGQTGAQRKRDPAYPAPGHPEDAA